MTITMEAMPMWFPFAAVAAFLIGRPIGELIGTFLWR